MIAALAAIVAAVGVWRARPELRPVEPVALLPIASVSGAPGGSTGSDPPGTLVLSGGKGDAPAPSRVAPVPVSVSAPEPIVVSVTGLVRRPGLVHLQPGARVADAIAAAGGLIDEANLTGLNLAARLVDGDSVVISGQGRSTLTGDSGGGGDSGGAGPPPSAGSGSRSPVNLNSADATDLEALPGVGPVTAADIIAWRDAHGPFTSVDELQAVPGIGPSKFARLAPLVSV